MAETLEELRNLPRDEIIRRHDRKAANTGVGTQHYLDELARRDAEDQGKRMEALTRSMHDQGKRMVALTRSMYVLSVVVTVATIVGAILTERWRCSPEARPGPETRSNPRRRA